MLTNGWWAWVGDPLPASETNDYGLAKREETHLAKLFEARDLMICDRAFRPLRDSLAILCGWIKPRGEALSNWKVHENKQVTDQRGNVL